MFSLFDEEEDAELFDVKTSKEKASKISKKDERAIQALRRRGLEDISDEERLIRFVYYARYLPMDSKQDAKKIWEVFNEHKGDADFLISTSMSSDLSRAKQILYNFICSKKGPELREKFSELHAGEKNMLAAPLRWQKGDDESTKRVVLEETNIEPDKITEVRRIRNNFINPL